MSDIDNLTNEDLKIIKPHFKNLHFLSIGTQEVDVADCRSLKTLDAPLATQINANYCRSLTTLTAPLANGINECLCVRLTSLTTPLAAKFFAFEFVGLTTLNALQATKIDASFCTSLTTLNAPLATEIDVQGCTSLTTLSKEQLPIVEFLKLGDAGVTALPEGIGTLDTLRTLKLSNSTDLTGLPDEILNLPPTCTVELSGCSNLSNAVRQRLREVTSQEGYQGPTFSYSMPSEEPSQQQPLEKILSDLWLWSGRPPEEFKHLPGDDVNEVTYTTWLNHLSAMADYKASGEKKKQLATAVLNILKLANEDFSYRQVFSAVIQEATTTCGDRMALSLLHLDIQRQLATFPISDMKKLANFLVRGVWTLSLLEGIAREKIPTLKFFDEIEVYLGYPVMLKERLQIPIGVESMLYFTCSALTKDDLNQAERHVRAITSNTQEVHKFLLSQDKWIEALKAKFSNEIKNLKEKRERALGSDVYEAATLANKEYEDHLVQLSKKALEEPAKMEGG